MKFLVELDVFVHPLTQPSAVQNQLAFLLQENLSVGKPGWFTFESDEQKGVPGTMFQIKNMQLEQKK